jgi:streptogramin lyase
VLHRASLALVAETLADAEDDWWLVGGAAVALQGLDIAIADIDVLMSRRDVVRVIARLASRPSKEWPSIASAPRSGRAGRRLRSPST